MTSSTDPNAAWIANFNAFLKNYPVVATQAWAAKFQSWFASNPLPTGTTPPPVTAVSPPASGGGSGAGIVGTGTSVKALDATDSPTAAWFKQAKADGFQLYVYPPLAWGVSTPRSDAQALFKMALDAGLKVAIYSRNPTWWSQAIKAVGSYAAHAQFFAIDIETDPGVKATQAMVDGVKALGVRPVIYSGYGMWPQIMGSTNTAFSTVPLWDTNAGSATSMNPKTYTPNILSPKPVAYGGWNTTNNMRIGVQQTFETVYNGINIDVNSFAADFLTVP